ncbi:hypothetical protein ACLMJK_004245 [Lecanora helva]
MAPIYISGPTSTSSLLPPRVASIFQDLRPQLSTGVKRRRGLGGSIKSGLSSGYKRLTGTSGSSGSTKVAPPVQPPLPNPKAPPPPSMLAAPKSSSSSSKSISSTKDKAKGLGSLRPPWNPKPGKIPGYTPHPNLPHTINPGYSHDHHGSKSASHHSPSPQCDEKCKIVVCSVIFGLLAIFVVVYIALKHPTKLKLNRRKNGGRPRYQISHPMRTPPEPEAGKISGSSGGEEMEMAPYTARPSSNIPAPQAAHHCNNVPDPIAEQNAPSYSPHIRFAGDHRRRSSGIPPPPYDSIDNDARSESMQVRGRSRSRSSMRMDFRDRSRGTETMRGRSSGSSRAQYVEEDEFHPAEVLVRDERTLSRNSRRGSSRSRISHQSFVDDYQLPIERRRSRSRSESRGSRVSLRPVTPYYEPEDAGLIESEPVFVIEEMDMSSSSPPSESSSRSRSRSRSRSSSHRAVTPFYELEAIRAEADLWDLEIDRSRSRSRSQGRGSSHRAVTPEYQDGW